MINFAICCILIVYVNCLFCSAHQTGHIVGGVYANIKDFPHAAYIFVKCVQDKKEDSKNRLHKSDNETQLTTERRVKAMRFMRYSCGSSIINEHFLLSAAHCFDDCQLVPNTFVMVSVGSANKRNGTLYQTKYFLRHERFKHVGLKNDIAIIKLYKPLKFSKYVKKVAIMKEPPNNESGELAGWGLINRRKPESTDFLKSTKQNIYTRAECINIFRSKIPVSTICAGFLEPKGEEGFSAKGDSGSGLIVRKYILVGLVSYGRPNSNATKESSIVVFTDVGYFYDWITANILKICDQESSSNKSLSKKRLYSEKYLT